MVPRTFFFAGKAAPAYYLAKVIIKLINNFSATIDADPAVRGRIMILFLPVYNVTLAERLIPASDVSNQISTAGYEANGTPSITDRAAASPSPPATYMPRTNSLGG